jgi:hypothetical protein
MRLSPRSKCFIQSPDIMPWVIEESDDCGVRWRRAELTAWYWHPRVAMREALEIIRDEWRPPGHSWRQLVHALERESVAYYWERGIRVVRR